MRKAREHEIQAAIVDALTLAGFRVKHTTAYRQKGASGVAKGIPDLLVSHRGIPLMYLGLEVKTPTGTLSQEQREAVDREEYCVVRSEQEALEIALGWLACKHCDGSKMDSDIGRGARVLKTLGKVTA